MRKMTRKELYFMSEMVDIGVNERTYTCLWKVYSQKDIENAFNKVANYESSTELNNILDDMLASLLGKSRAIKAAYLRCLDIKDSISLKVKRQPRRILSATEGNPIFAAYRGLLNQEKLYQLEIKAMHRNKLETIQ